ncbi:hypothetical protein ACJX0J_025887, partial [Zea mays]
YEPLQEDHIPYPTHFWWRHFFASIIIQYMFLCHKLFLTKTARRMPINICGYHLFALIFPKTAHFSLKIYILLSSSHGDHEREEEQEHEYLFYFILINVNYMRI